MNTNIYIRGRIRKEEVCRQKKRIKGEHIKKKKNWKRRKERVEAKKRITRFFITTYVIVSKEQ
jgi:hypothetical protein